MSFCVVFSCSFFHFLLVFEPSKLRNNCLFTGYFFVFTYFFFFFCFLKPDFHYFVSFYLFILFVCNLVCPGSLCFSRILRHCSEAFRFCGTENLQHGFLHKIFMSFCLSESCSMGGKIHNWMYLPTMETKMFCLLLLMRFQMSETVTRNFTQAGHFETIPQMCSKQAKTCERKSKDEERENKMVDRS